MTERRDGFIDEARAHTFVEIIDLLPPPRLIEPTDEVKGFGETLSMLSVDVAMTDLGFTAELLTGTITDEQISAAAIRSLRNAGQRVGPFRGRKIRKIISLSGGAESE